MSEPFRVEGVSYSVFGIETIRRDLAKMREEAARQGAYGPAVTMSHAVALLGYLQELVAAVIERRDMVINGPTAELPIMPLADDWRRVSTLTDSPCMRRDVPPDEQRICAYCGWVAGRHTYWPGQRATLV